MTSDRGPAAPAGATRWPRDAWALPALVKAGLLPADAAAALRAEAPEWVAHLVVERGLATAERTEEVLAKASHAPLASLEKVEPAAAHVLPEPVARQYAALPLSTSSRTIRIATANPLDFDAERALGFATSRAVEFLYALPGPLAQRIDEIYRPERSIERIVGGLGVEATVEPAPEAPAPAADAAVEAPATRLVDATIADAVRERASDIHLEPGDTALVIRYRVDGVVREVMRVPKNAAGAVVRRVKVVAKLDIADHLRAREGRATARVDGKLWELRVATTPVARLGESIVIRLHDPGAPTFRLDGMGFWPDEQAGIEALLQQRAGIVLVTGPAGNGRKSTVGAAQEHLRLRGADPVTLELRYGETATAACQAASEGRLVLATLDGTDAVSGLARLRELGVDSHRIAASLKGVLAQRLLRHLCPKCAEPAGPDSLPLAWQPPLSWKERPIAVRRPKGCSHCGFTGYRGRFAVAEILTVDGQVAELIATGAPPERLVETARRYGMRPLWEVALRRVWAGETGYEEAVRVVGEPVRRPPEVPAPRAVERVVPAAMPAPTAAVTEEPQRQIPLVLIADDDPAMRDLESAVLQAAGLAVAESADGAEALELARALHPSIMLLDMDMPELTGLEVLEQLRSTLSGRGVPVIVVTAHDDPETESRCIELGAEDYITKPIQPATLVARIRAVLRRAYGGGTG